MMKKPCVHVSCIIAVPCDFINIALENNKISLYIFGILLPLLVWDFKIWMKAFLRYQYWIFNKYIFTNYLYVCKDLFVACQKIYFLTSIAFMQDKPTQAAFYLRERFNPN